MKEKLLEVEQLSFSYEEGKSTLENVSVVIHEKEKIAVLGENGAGKSTFFLNINGVRTPDPGVIRLCGEEIRKKNRNLLRKKVGIVFQDADNQIIASTVKAEVAFGPMNMQLPREEVEKRTIAAMEEMELLDYAARPPHYLSGGEKKRVSIADILAMDTPIIIFDEPTASLDPVNAQLLEEVLGRLEQSGKTILLSTHDVDFAYRFADRILVFSQGKLIADSVPQQIFSDDVLLKTANLKKPVMMELCDMLQKKHLLEAIETYPRSLPELEKILGPDSDVLSDHETDGW